ncbi:DUF1642 domain-containing protein [Pediococcus pentosaceus]|uniref:DUF1642 domain-containing protein n=1 Tax=Pediococcus pentosaceus TaxID=1255 RepID=UPI0021E76D84|nr:DUF1642 domain-containing protein [Pediococcus pentosaceus]MCV3330065.1 DUF1642 domain-containing protein [Pediococcus pentosaceus]
MLKEYRKTATVKAEQFNPDEYIPEYAFNNLERVPWTTSEKLENMLSILKTGEPKPDWRIKTIEGDMKINPGDWIATGVEGEHWAIADDVFKKTYAELPVIPKMYADTIEEFKANHYRLNEMFDEWDWNYYEQELIARSWLDGYVVED